MEPIEFTISVEDQLLIERRIRRQEDIDNLCYDGRHAPRVQESKKNKRKKKKCRKNVTRNYQ